MAFQVAVENEEVAKGLSASQARKALAERCEMLAAIQQESGPDYDASKVTTIAMKDGHELATFIRKMNDEMTFIGKRVGEFDELDKIAAENQKRLGGLKEHPVDPSRFAPGKAGDRPVLKSLGQMFAESGALKAARLHQVGSFEAPDADAKALIELKANFLTTAGWAPESLRTGRVVLDAQADNAEVLDVLPVFPTSMAAIVYMEETTFTSAAAERAEAGAYAESAFALTQRSVTVRSIGTSLPVTDEQLEDVEGVQGYLDQRLGFTVRQRLGSQCLVGNGTPPNLTGTLSTASILTQAKGGDPTPDAIYKGMVQVRVTGMAMPNVVFAHPNDWQAVRLLRTSDGIYIWGSPSEAGPSRIWGVPVIETMAVTENTMIVGDYARFSGLHVKKGLELQTGYVNDDFKNGMVTLRAGMRVAIVHYRPEAFCQVTGV
jgi:HK97 family phage major capsid protein